MYNPQVIPSLSKQQAAMSVKKYLDEHHNQEFWKEIFNSTQQTLVAKNQIIKIEANKLRAERVKLILDNIEDILEGQVKRLQIKNEMNEIKKEKPQNLLKELEEIKNEKTDTSYKFLIQKDKSLLQIFDLPQILQTLQEQDPSKYLVVRQRLLERLKNYPVVAKLLVHSYRVKTKPSSTQNYLLYQRYIQSKDLDEEDLFLLQSEYWPLATKKLQEKELGKLLQGLWRDNKLKENIWGKKAQQIEQKFREQTHF